LSPQTIFKRSRVLDGVFDGSQGGRDRGSKGDGIDQALTQKARVHHLDEIHNVGLEQPVVGHQGGVNVLE
jgi:hypothetical protein